MAVAIVEDREVGIGQGDQPVLHVVQEMIGPLAGGVAVPVREISIDPIIGQIGPSARGDGGDRGGAAPPIADFVISAGIV